MPNTAGRQKPTPSIWWTVFMVPIVVVNVMPHHAVDAAHAHASAVFRIVVTLVCMVGLTVTWIREATRPKVIAPPPTYQAVVAATPAAVAVTEIPVTYTTTQAAYWRCHSYLIFRSEAGLPALTFLGLLTGGVLWLVARNWLAALGGWSFPLLALVGIAGWLVAAWFDLQRGTRKRYPTPDTVRTCTTSLTPEGIRDVLPEKAKFHPWEKIARVRLREGDVLVSSASGSLFVPREAFADPEAARRFYDAAVALWQSRGAAWPQVAGAAVPPSGTQAPAEFIV